MCLFTTLTRTAPATWLSVPRKWPSTTLAMSPVSSTRYWGRLDRPVRPPSISVSEPTFTFSERIETTTAEKGLAAGDLNNDGVLDLVIGTPSGYELRRGGVEILLGPFDGSDIDLRDDADGLLLGSTGDISSTVKGDGDGASVAIGDINGDVVVDLIVNARSADVGAIDNGDIDNAGETYILFGPLDTLEGELKTLADVTIQGVAERDSASEGSLAIGDLNGDGTNDLVVGSSQSDASGNRASGKVLIFQGPIGSGTYNLEADAQIVIEGDKALEGLGSAVGIGRLQRRRYGPISRILPHLGTPMKRDRMPASRTSCLEISSSGSLRPRSLTFRRSSLAW